MTTLAIVIVVMTVALPLTRRWHRRLAHRPAAGGRERQPLPPGASRPLCLGYQVSTANRLLSRVSARLREFTDLQVELSERRVLLNRPWEEDLLHWARDDHGWRLHGHLLPPGGRRRRSTTSRGWCPALQATPESPTSAPPP